MGKYKVVVSDLDGTLLNNKKEISDENKAAIIKMRELGISFVASSGRCHSEMPGEIMNNPDIKYVSCSDGAVIYDKETGEVLVKNCIPKEISAACVNILKDYEILPMTHRFGELYIDGGRFDHEIYRHNNVTAPFEKLMGELGHRVEDCLNEATLDGETELFCVFFHSREELSECVKRLLALGEVKIASSEKDNIEVFYKNAGKGGALHSMAKLFDCDISEIIAVGDSKNDIEMVVEAGLGLGMANSMPELLSVADEVICNNEEHAAKYILENYII